MARTISRRGKRVGLAATLVGAMVTAACVTQSETTRTTQRFLVASDIHFDPFYDPALVARLAAAPVTDWDGIFHSSTVTGIGAYGQDTPWPLLMSALGAMKAAEAQPDFMLISGDVLAHGFQKLYQQSMPNGGAAGLADFTTKTVAYVADKLRQTYPKTPVILALGNNDDDCGDYEIQPDGPFLKASARIIEGLLNKPITPAQEASWSALGNFVAPHPTLKGVKVAAVNTIYFSPRYKNACAAKGVKVDPGAATLAWLTGVLDQAAKDGEKVWLVQHIPPGIDAYSTTKSLTCAKATAANITPMFAPKYQTAYDRLMIRHSATVGQSFSGHTHMDDFRLIGKGANASRTLITLAISPIFGQNPGFRVFDMAADGTLTNQTTRYLVNLVGAGTAEGAVWAKEYDFNTAWGEKGVDQTALTNIFDRIKAGGPALERYERFYTVTSTQNVGLTSATAKGFVCATGNAIPADFLNCWCGGK